jgi:hypothetical protein
MLSLDMDNDILASLIGVGLFLAFILWRLSLVGKSAFHLLNPKSSEIKKDESRDHLEEIRLFGGLEKAVFYFVFIFLLTFGLGKLFIG